MKLRANHEKTQVSKKRHSEIIRRFDRIDAHLESEFRTMRREVLKSKDIAEVERLKLDSYVQVYQYTDTRIHLQPPTQNSCTIFGQLDGVGEIECIPLVGEQSASGAQLPRLINIYSKISQRTFVRKLHGVMQNSQGDFAMMDSLASATNLDHALQSGEFKSQPLDKRLRFLYEICETVQYLHSIGILLKCLSSVNIFFVVSPTGSGSIRPILIGLENARLVLLSLNAYELWAADSQLRLLNRVSKLNTIHVLKHLTSSFKVKICIRYTLIFGGTELPC
jgi:hypothetical protein